MEKEKKTNIRERIVFSFFLLAFVFCLISPIVEIDFFWHLATGRWIWEHKNLPEEDPFSYTTSPVEHKTSLKTKIILTQYWFANIIQYGSYKLSGYAGIIGLRIIILLSTVIVVFMHLIRKRNMDIVSATILLLPLSYMLIEFKDDRPNQMTFLFLAVFLYFIDSLKKGEKAGYFLPFFFILWANIHSGFILGAAIGFIYIISELLRIIVLRAGPGIKDYKPDYRFILITTITILAGLLNPNGYGVVYLLAKKEFAFSPLVAELMTPFEYVPVGVYKYIPLTGMFLLPAILSIFVRLFPLSSQSHFPVPSPESSSQDDRKNMMTFLSLLEELFLVILFGLLSLRAVRGIPLLAIAMTPVIGSIFTRLDGSMKRLSRYLVPEAAIAGAIVFFAYTYWPSTLLNKPVLFDYFPEDAVAFIRNNGLKGRIFNHYDWGGYLIWRFYPERAVFIDGRNLDQDVLLNQISVLTGSKKDIGGKPAYKAILDNYEVRNILIPSVSIKGALFHLIPVLVDDPEWKLIFYSKNCLLFTRDYFEPEYPKDLSYAIALTAATQHMTSNPDNPIPYLTIAKANIGLRRTDEAVNILRKALSRRHALRGGPVEEALNLVSGGKDILHETYGLPAY